MPMLDDRLVAVAVQAARHAVARARTPSKWPATVLAIDPVLVKRDGATNTVEVGAVVDVAVGDRVLVETQPSLAAYITAVI